MNKQNFINPITKKLNKFCLECNTLLARLGSKYCQKCYLKKHKGKNHPNFNKKGRLSTHWRGGNNRCIDCHKLLSNRTGKRCRKCWHKFHKGTNCGKTYKDGRTNKRYYCIDCGKKISNYQHKRCKQCFQDEKLHSNWLGGISKLPYSFKWTKELKEQIRKRDNYLCKICHKHQINDLKQFKKKFPIHHIDYNKKNCSEDNLITLCKSCHHKTNKNRNYWRTYLKWLLTH